MRVLCSSIEAFLENLRGRDSSEIHLATIWVDKTENEVSPDSGAFLVTIQASVVVVAKDGSEFLLQGGEECGTDYSDGTAEKNGTSRANQLRKMLIEICEKNEWTIRPGVLDI